MARQLPARRKKRTATSVTNQEIFEEFCEKYEVLVPHINKWMPSGFLSIKITFKCHPPMQYNYITKQARLLDGRDTECWTN